MATFAIHLTGAEPADRQAAAGVTIADLTPEPLTRALSSLQRAGAAYSARTPDWQGLELGSRTHINHHKVFVLCDLGLQRLRVERGNGGFLGQGRHA